MIWTTIELRDSRLCNDGGLGVASSHWIFAMARAARGLGLRAWPRDPASGRTPKTLYSSVCWTFLEVEPDERARLSPPACPGLAVSEITISYPNNCPRQRASSQSSHRTSCKARGQMTGETRKNQSARSFRSFLGQRVPILRGARHEAQLASVQGAVLLPLASI